MAKVSVKLGLTLPGQEQYSSFRVDFAISEIDTEGDVEQQLKDALEAGDQATVVAETGLAQQASNLSGITLEGVGLGEQFASFRKKFSPLWERLVERVRSLEEPNVAYNAKPQADGCADGRVIIDPKAKKIPKTKEKK